RRSAVRGVPAAATTTPVDLSSYTTHLARAQEIAAASGGASSASHEATITLDSGYGNGSQGNGRTPLFSAPSVTLNRRTPVEMSLPRAANGGAPPAMSSGDDSAIDYSNPIDVPAFLRRQN